MQTGEETNAEANVSFRMPDSLQHNVSRIARSPGATSKLKIAIDSGKLDRQLSTCKGRESGAQAKSQDRARERDGHPPEVPGRSSCLAEGRNQRARRQSVLHFLPLLKWDRHLLLRHRPRVPQPTTPAERCRPHSTNGIHRMSSRPSSRRGERRDGRRRP